MSVKTKKQILDYINSQEPNVVFTAFSVVKDDISPDAARMALERMAAKGIIRKLDKGRYYRPKQTMFGEIGPDIEQVVGDLVMDKNHQPIGYLTGMIMFAQMGLTTQISSWIELGVRKYRRRIKRGRYTVSFILQPNPITMENIELLQLLDAIRFCREISGTDTEEAVERLIFLVGKLSNEQKSQITELALPYAPYVRALLGAIMEHLGFKKGLQTLRSSLNPMTRYRLYISEEILPTRSNWNIR